VPGTRPNVQATKAAVENLNLLQQGKGEIAFTLGDSLQSAWAGDNEAGFRTKLDKLRGIAAVYPNYIQIVATKESGIRTLADLKGKRISVGAARSGTELNARAVFAAAGLAYKDMSKVEYLPSAWDAIRNGWFLLLPLAALIYLLFAGYTPLFAGTIGLALTVVVILGGAIALRVGPFGLRVAFWVALGLVCASFFRYGLGVLLGAVGLLILANLFKRGGRETLLLCRDSRADGARQALPVGLACAVVGIVIGIGRDNLFLALVLTMRFSLVLGMGIPTIPNYIITSSLAAPILVKLGVPEIVASDTSSCAAPA
jgi:hypothetical protein